MGIWWQVKATNVEVLDRTGLMSIESMVIKVQFCWTGHMIRMDSSRVPCQVMYVVLAQGK